MPEKRRIEKSKAQNESSGSIRLYQAISSVLALIVIFQAVYIFYPSLLISKATSLAIPDLSTSGFDKIDSIVATTDGTDGNLALKSGCYEVSAAVEPYQVNSINDGLQGNVGPRPNAHDLAVDVFRTLKIDVLMVKIVEVRNSLFISKLVLRQGNTILNFEARPSDAIAIAVRMKADIYMNDTLLKAQGKNVC